MWRVVRVKVVRYFDRLRGQGVSGKWAVELSLGKYHLRQKGDLRLSGSTMRNWVRQVKQAHGNYIVVTSLPLHPLATYTEEARRARAVANWLKSDEYLEGHPNVFVFAFFDMLADPSTGALCVEYQLGPDNSDSHRNRLANETIGPLFVKFIDNSVQTYKRRKPDNH